MKLALVLAGLTLLAALGFVGWGPLPKEKRIALQILRARSTLRWGSEDTRYLLAEALFQEGEFERALAQCERVLERNPRHAPARALFTEVRFILGIGAATTDVDYSAYFISNLGVGPGRPSKDGSTDD